MYVEREIIIACAVIVMLAVGYLVFNFYCSIAAEQLYQQKEKEAKALLENAKDAARRILNNATNRATAQKEEILKEAYVTADAEKNSILRMAEEELEKSRQQLFLETEEINAGIEQNRKALQNMVQEVDVLYNDTVVAYSGVTDVTVLNGLSSTELKQKWGELRIKEKELIQTGAGVVVEVPAEGKVFVGSNIKRILRNFNSDCDCYLAWLSSVGVEETQKKIQHSYDVLNKLYGEEGVTISPSLLALKLEEAAICGTGFVPEEKGVVDA